MVLLLVILFLTLLVLIVLALGLIYRRLLLLTLLIILVRVQRFVISRCFIGCFKSDAVEHVVDSLLDLLRHELRAVTTRTALLALSVARVATILGLLRRVQRVSLLALIPLPLARVILMSRRADHLIVALVLLLFTMAFLALLRHNIIVDV